MNKMKCNIHSPREIRKLVHTESAYKEVKFFVAGVTELGCKLSLIE
jgi:predicted transposase YdaD